MLLKSSKLHRKIPVQETLFWPNCRSGAFLKLFSNLFSLCSWGSLGQMPAHYILFLWVASFSYLSELIVNLYLSINLCVFFYLLRKSPNISKIFPLGQYCAEVKAKNSQPKVGECRRFDSILRRKGLKSECAFFWTYFLRHHKAEIKWTRL